MNKLRKRAEKFLENGGMKIRGEKTIAWIMNAFIEQKRVDVEIAKKHLGGRADEEIPDDKEEAYSKGVWDCQTDIKQKIEIQDND